MSVALDLKGASARPIANHAPYAGIYRYDEFDREFVRERVAQFRAQVTRRLSGELNEDEFRPIRLMNGLYLQLHAYMLRIAVPYGVLSSAQLRQLAHIGRVYDRGYGHFTTRQNLQFNWPKLVDTPDILDALADVDMHAIQTSGNCIRNVTTDEFGGAAADEIVDPRIYAEIMRQWSSLHPEFSFLPRKFKIAITGSPCDRAAIRVHDIGIIAVQNAAGAVGFEIYAGGGLGRTPYVGVKMTDWVTEPDLLAYLEAILRVYNALGRRDNIYKARIKILVQETGADAFRAMVEQEFATLPRDKFRLDPAIVAEIRGHFADPPFEGLPTVSPAFEAARQSSPAFARWAGTNLHPHRVPGYVSAVISLKPDDGIPGDMTSDQMDAVADLADRLSFGEIRVTHEQNLVLPHVRLDDVPALWRDLGGHGLATANIGLVTDMIVCPGLDYCALANARSIPVGQRIADRFKDLDLQHKIGELHLNISGCINACGHHHVGHIGILGVDKKGVEFYQVTLGGSPGTDAADPASIGAIIGPAFSYDDIPDAVEKVIHTYLGLRRDDGERFIDAYRRVGMKPFKEALYGAR